VLDRKLKASHIIMRLVREHVMPYKGKFMVAVAFMIVSALCASTVVWLVQPTIDQVFISHDHTMLVTMPLAIFIVYSIKGIAEYFQSYIIKYVGQEILTNLQMRMYEHLLFSDYAFLQAQSSGRLISRFTNDITLMRGAVSNLLVGCAKHFLSIIFLVIVMFKLEPLLSAFVFLAFPFAVYPIQKLGRKMRSVTDSAQEELGNFTSRLDEVFFSVKIIKSFCTEHQEAENARKITSRILSFYKKSAKFDSLSSPVMEVLTGIAVACVLWYGGYSVMQGTMTTGALFAFITAFISAYRPFKSLVAFNVNLQEGVAAANRVFNVLDLPPTICDIKKPLKPKWERPNIEFKDVELSFGANKFAIKSLDLEVKSGKTYALVGRSGSGKTSAINLLIRLFDPTKGSIYINGDDIRKISLQSLRGQIAMVSQDTMLFDGTIAENIAYGSVSVSKQKIIEAAKAADAHDFITELPDGYNSKIGVFGSSLSGGQKQRLSIARAFLKDAPILLLDEATSALDSRSEQSVISALENLRKNRTTIVVTHRLSSITDADQIVVMKQGKVVEQGSHQELLKMKKEYHKLYNKELKETGNSI
jgi:subfamily B ATP-binding cassette protein MsbA